MTVFGRGKTTAGANRLIYGYVDGTRRSPRRMALDIAVAKGLDRGAALCGVARPALFVSGFWRSGTTWLQESLASTLGAKTIFEPLAPMEPHIREMMRRRLGQDSEDVRHATILGPLPYDDPLWRYLDHACTGRRTTSYMMSCRQRVSESLLSTTVVKDVRLQANLAAVHHRYGVPVVHVRRHPCAAVASLIAADWHWSFARVPLATVLPRLGAALDEDRRAMAMRFDGDTLSRIAAFWAVTERIAEATLTRQSWGAVLSYERFAAEPDAALSAVCGRLGLKRIGTIDFTQPSASVNPEAFAAYAVPAADRWRGMLSERERDHVLAIADMLHPQWRIGDVLAS